MYKSPLDNFNDFYNQVFEKETASKQNNIFSSIFYFFDMAALQNNHTEKIKNIQERNKNG